MRVASDMREAMWGLLQSGISQLDFDFREYADKHFQRAGEGIGDPHWSEWLKEACAWRLTSPPRPSVVIIGGGVGGCSIAYHLTQMGWKDVVVLERGELTSGSTWHSAGLVGQLRSDFNLTRMMKYSTDLYRTAEGRDRRGHRLARGRRLAPGFVGRAHGRTQAPGRLCRAPSACRWR